MNIPFHNENLSSDHLDLNQFLIKRKSSTFIFKVEGDSMRDANIQSGDLLIIDRSKDPIHGSLVVGIVNAEFVVKEYIIRGKDRWLVSKNKNITPVKIYSELDFKIWGIVTYIIHHAEKNNSIS